MIHGHRVQMNIDNGQPILTVGCDAEKANQ
jgi:hypothetical protein